MPLYYRPYDDKYSKILGNFRINLWFERGVELCVIPLGLDRERGDDKVVDIIILDWNREEGGIKYGVFYDVAVLDY